MKRVIVVSLFLLPLLASAAGLEPRPGRYEVVTKEGNDSTKTSYHCLTAGEIAKGFEAPTQPGCKVTHTGMNGGKFGMSMTCPDVTSSFSGTYTPTGYVVDGKLHAKVGNQFMDVITHATAKRVGDTCKPDDE